MMIKVENKTALNQKLVYKYFKHLVNRFFKILPMRENNEETLPSYIQSLQLELLGCNNLVEEIHNQSDFLTLLSILQYFIDNPVCNTEIVRREVFRAISICNALQNEFVSPEVIT